MAKHALKHAHVFLHLILHLKMIPPPPKKKVCFFYIYILTLNPSNNEHVGYVKSYHEKVILLQVWESMFE